MTTLRLLLPQWQGGMNPHYVLGAELLALIAPPSDKAETVTVDVRKDFDKGLQTEKGVDRYQDLMNQLVATRQILERKQPDKIIAFGGDCSVSQAPFSYLLEKYGEKLGILWLDAHPDIARADQSSHLNEMVLGNLIGEGNPAFAEQVKQAIAPEKVMYGGLIEKELRPIDDGVWRHHIPFANPEDLQKDSQVILNWLEANQLEFLAIHFDLDVLSPMDFRSIYPAEPHTRLEDFPAAVGELTLEQIVRMLNDVHSKAKIVGLTLAEHLPWDAIRLRESLSQIPIFK
ncbi:arginase family protein [Streptococcus oricebi]|uniref:Arginase n=1 Tax=Streptococcus oricebi TaxID=1547447 RepID=A0ABS5B4K2_9STRE|nr:arginase family protein [Streptococcus oricebi]MBP2623761.1 arginase [Streptococcus oricebi]